MSQENSLVGFWGVFLLEEHQISKTRSVSLDTYRCLRLIWDANSLGMPQARAASKYRTSDRCAEATSYRLEYWQLIRGFDPF